MESPSSPSPDSWTATIQRKQHRFPVCPFCCVPGPIAAGGSQGTGQAGVVQGPAEPGWAEQHLPHSGSAQCSLSGYV